MHRSDPDQHKMADVQWKSGTLVKINSIDLVMTVVGYDSVGSVICEWNREGQPVRGYVTAAVLALARSALPQRTDIAEREHQV